MPWFLIPKILSLFWLIKTIIQTKFWYWKSWRKQIFRANYRNNQLQFTKGYMPAQYFVFNYFQSESIGYGLIIVNQQYNLLSAAWSNYIISNRNNCFIQWILYSYAIILGRYYTASSQKFNPYPARLAFATSIQPGQAANPCSLTWLYTGGWCIPCTQRNSR